MPESTFDKNFNEFVQQASEGHGCAAEKALNEIMTNSNTSITETISRLQAKIAEENKNSLPEIQLQNYNDDPADSESLVTVAQLRYPPEFPKRLLVESITRDYDTKNIFCKD